MCSSSPALTYAVAYAGVVEQLEADVGKRVRGYGSMTKVVGIGLAGGQPALRQTSRCSIGAAAVETPDSLPLGGLVSGRDAVIANFAQIPSYWSSFSVEPQEYIDAGDHVVVTGVQRATGPGGSFESRYLHLFKLSGGHVVRGEFIGDTAKAQDALGS
jgi:ketosteroid isomerase-like protein